MHKPYGVYERMIKRPVDFLLALLAFILLSPIMLVVSVLVRIKLGSPIIFKQERPGKIDPKTGQSKIFRLYKFRTMTDAVDKNGNALSDEERMTAFGQKLRSTSLDELPELWNIIRGDSDHVAPDETMMTLATAYMLGAEVIEKHFTLDKTLPGNDHYHAGEPEDFKKAISNFRWIDTVLGSPEKTVLDCEQIPRREARRSLVLTRNMKAGEVIQKEDLMPKRPGTGISPNYFDIVIGRRVVKDLDEDTILTWDMI